VIDAVSKSSIPGANVVIMDSHPILGSATDFDGNFSIDKVQVGRIALYITSMGYEPKVIANIIVASAREVVINVELTESVIQLDDITVNGKRNKRETLNKMAMVSAKSFSVEETSRYAGSFNDAARMVSSYAGVTGLGFGNNDIVVRGNSPKGVLWKLEGVEIPNPNHFASDGSTGGPINALNSAMLSNSDFFTSAFPAEYGNAYSGVFDMKLRTGNNQTREYMASLGALGTDITLEGPFKAGYGGSYLLNYRYSSLSIIDDLGLVDFNGVPKYQDMCFNVVLPTKTKGTIAMYGLGGISSINQTFERVEEGDVIGKNKNGADLGVLGLRHTYPLNNNWYLKNIVVANATRKSNENDHVSENHSGFFRIYEDEFIDSEIKYVSEVNGKINARNSIKAGITYSQKFFDIRKKIDTNETGFYTTILDADGNAGLVQAYANWMHRYNENLTFTAGAHYMQFLLNNNYSIEPRVGMKWQFSPKQSLNIGAGVHSKIENLSVYYANVYEGNSVTYEANKNLDLTKALHSVVGYTNQITPNMYVKLEAYYQHLYDVPVKDDPNSPYVYLNEWDGSTKTFLCNDGIGRNYGLEMTLERFFSNNYYFMLTGSVYDAQFKAKDGKWNSSQYNNHYAANFLIGRDFVLGDPQNGLVLNINTKMSYVGATPYSPINLEKSRAAKGTEIYWDQYMQAKGDNIFNLDFAIGLRWNRPCTSHELKLDINNALNSQATVLRYYDYEKDNILEVPQMPMIPNIMYVVYF
jgi:hypothetical protein